MSNKNTISNHKEVSEKKGQLSVHTENLLPIIKKWLYSERDIFLRELISNAHDAIKKLDRLADIGEFKDTLPEALINIKLNKDKKTLTFIDTGLGMDAEEIEKYINQIAFSGAEEFVKKHHKKGEENQIIGHFGLGFFSSYMAADLVEINTLSYKKGAQSVFWSSDGSTNYSIKAGTKKEIGTEITLHISKENEELLNEEKIKNLVKTYSDFLPVEIQINDKKVNEMTAIWQKKPTTLKEKDYLDFYKKIFPYEEDPVFYIHLNIDFPFKLKGLLYFPKLKADLDINAKGRIKLFSNNVFVSDNILNIIPNYFNLLRGVIDSPDIPLNVSRSALQTDSNVKKISLHIIKKISDRLHEIFKEKKSDYEKNWDSISPFIKLGAIDDGDFYEKIKDIIIFKNHEGKFTSLEDYKKNNPKIKDKILYTNDLTKQALFIDNLTREGVEILVFDSPIDNHFIQNLEVKESPIRFLRVDSDTSDNLLKKNEDNKKEEISPDNKAVIDFVKKSIDKDNLDISLSPLKDESTPCLFILNEHMRRFKEMSFFQSLGKEKQDESLSGSLVLNENNPLIKKIKSLSTLEVPESKAKAKNLAKNVFHLGLLQQGLLQGKDLSAFINKSTELLEKNI